MDPITLLLIALGVFTAGYLFLFTRALMRDAKEGIDIKPEPKMAGVSLVMNFLDTLGIGSFATTTSAVRAMKLIPDQKLPGSLNVGYVIPTIAQAFIYTKRVEVGPTTLVAMIVAALVGAWLGAGVVSGWPRRKIQMGMGLCLLGAATIMVIRMANKVPPGTDIELHGVKLAMGVGGNFLLGALMTLGIGLYAPCLILVSLLGMQETAAFPIMMGSCAFLMPIACVQFIKNRAYHPKAMLSMALPGIPAVLIGAFIITSVPLTVVKWLVVLVVTFTAINLLRAAAREKSATLASDATAAEAGA